MGDTGEKAAARCPHCGYCEHCGQSRMRPATPTYWPTPPPIWRKTIYGEPFHGEVTYKPINTMIGERERERVS